MSEFMLKESELENEIAPALSVAREIVVVDAATYEMAGQTVKDLTGIANKIKAFWAPEKEMASKLHKSLVAKEKSMLEPVEAEKAAKVASMRKWADEQERLRREEQARAEEEARRAAEEAALAQAVALEANGHKAAAEAVIAAPVVAPPVYVPKTTPAGFGQFTRKTWKAEVMDMMELVKAVASGQVPIQAIQADMVFLGAQARALKGALSYPGVRSIEV